MTTMLLQIFAGETTINFADLFMISLAVSSLLAMIFGAYCSQALASFIGSRSADNALRVAIGLTATNWFGLEALHPGWVYMYPERMMVVVILLAKIVFGASYVIKVYRRMLLDGKQAVWETGP